VRRRRICSSMLSAVLDVTVRTCYQRSGAGPCSRGGDHRLDSAHPELAHSLWVRTRGGVGLFWRLGGFGGLGDLRMAAG